MGSFKLNETDKTYDSELETWIDSQGRNFIKNFFDPNNPSFIDITTDYWGIDNSGHYIDWIKLDLPKNIELAFKIAIRKKLKHVSPGYITKCRLMFAEFKAELNPQHLSLTDLKMSEVNVIWQKMTPDYRCFFRELYTYLANQNIGGASKVIAIKLKQMNARSETRNLKYVLNWHATKGALTQEEESILRKAIETKPSNEKLKQLETRIFCWLLIATLKRSKQIRELHLDCLSSVTNNGTTSYYVHVKPIKKQTGDPYRWWPIPEALYREMNDYSNLPSVQKLQKKYDLFWVMNCPSLHRYQVVSSADANNALVQYVKALKLISPRTQKPLHITPIRIRHTGATRLAFKGVPRDIISEILEHDDPNSCQAYIDAIGSELCPALNMADRNMGSLFSHFSQIYFHGQIVDQIANQPIVIPDFSENSPLFVGSCARDTCKEGQCKKHPFIGCYNGCTSFLAWREADHHRALAFADKELDRWRKVSVHNDQVSTVKEYEDLRNNILLVIERIDEMKGLSNDL